MTSDHIHSGVVLLFEENSATHRGEARACVVSSADGLLYTVADDGSICASSARSMASRSDVVVVLQ